MRTERIAGLAALLTLVVVAASAAIRLGADALGADIVLARGVHRIVASLAAVLVIVVFAGALRRRRSRPAATAALLLMLALSAVGWATGTQPPPAAALFNQLGGVALAALLAWLAGRLATGVRSEAVDRSLALAALLFAALQIVFGAALVVLGPPLPVALVVAHAVLGLTAAAIGAALGASLWRIGDARLGAGLCLCAALAPLAGVAVVLPAPAIAIQVGHATAGALLLAAIANARGRMADFD